MAASTFEEIWRRIEKFAGEPFETVRGIDFSYEIRGHSLRTSRTDYNLSRSNFEKAWSMLGAASRSQLNAAVRGPSYVIAILEDKRISRRQPSQGRT